MQQCEEANKQVPKRLSARIGIRLPLLCDPYFKKSLDPVLQDRLKFEELPGCYDYSSGALEDECRALIKVRFDGRRF